MTNPALGDIRIISDGTNPSDLRLTSDRRRHIAKVYARSADQDREAMAIATLFSAAPAMLDALKAARPHLSGCSCSPSSGCTVAATRAAVDAAITQATQDQGGDRG